MKAISKFRSIILISIFALCSKAWGYQVDCSPEKGRIDLGPENVRHLSFHNGGGSWTGYYRPYLTFKVSQGGNLYDFEYNKKEVELMEIFENYYIAEITVSTLYTDDVIVHCNIRG